MAFKSIKDIPDIQKQPQGPEGPRRFFYDRARIKEIEQVLENVEPLALQYELYRQQLSNELAHRFGYTPEQLEDTLDSYLTKASYYNKNKLKNDQKRSVGRFETGSDLFEAQKQAKELLHQNPSAYAVVYGLYPRGFDNPKNIGLKKPFAVQDYNELKDVNDSLVYGDKNIQLRPEVFYRDKLNWEE